MTALRSAHRRGLRRLIREPALRGGSSGVTLVLMAEVFASVLGFAALVHQTRVLGAASFGRLEYAASILAWVLVLVRGGCDQIVYREAARHPRLTARLTDLLIGLRLLLASAAYLLIVTAMRVGGRLDPVVVVAGLALFATSGAADVGPRASGRLGWVAMGQGVRGLGLLVAVVLLVRGPADAVRAACCLVLAECLAAAVVLIDHARSHTWPRPSLRRRASLILAHRGAVAGLARFGRVSLYAVDILVVGLCFSMNDVGTYGAARRLVFAVISLGLVVPASLTPLLGRAWAEGLLPARSRLSEMLAWVWSLGLPAAVGLGLTAGALMPGLFGDHYRDGGRLLALIAARLPWLLLASVAQAALVACRREDLSLRLIGLQLSLAAVVYPCGLVFAGLEGVGWSAIVVELAGAVAGWSLLRKLGVAPDWRDPLIAPFIGSLGMAVACRTGQGSLGWVCVKGASVYAILWWLVHRRRSTRGCPP